MSEPLAARVAEDSNGGMTNDEAFDLLLAALVPIRNRVKQLSREGFKVALSYEFSSQTETERQTEVLGVIARKVRPDVNHCQIGHIPPIPGIRPKPTKRRYNMTPEGMAAKREGMREYWRKKRGEAV